MWSRFVFLYFCDPRGSTWEDCSHLTSFSNKNECSKFLWVLLESDCALNDCCLCKCLDLYLYRAAPLPQTIPNTQPCRVIIRCIYLHEAGGWMPTICGILSAESPSENIFWVSFRLSNQYQMPSQWIWVQTKASIVSKNWQMGPWSRIEFWAHQKCPEVEIAAERRGVGNKCKAWGNDVGGSIV